MKTAVIAIAVTLVLAVSTLNAFAQDNGGAPPPPPAGGGPASAPVHVPGGWFHLLPPRAQGQLNLTADQQKQVADSEAETKAKLEKILTADQLLQLKQMRPPRPQGGRVGGPDAGGPGAGGPGGVAGPGSPAGTAAGSGGQ